MANEALVSVIKGIIANARGGKLDEAYQGYRELFSSPIFRTYEPSERRQALKLMVLAKGIPDPAPPAILEAHRAAIEPLTELVSAHGEPGDYEMLGICHVVLGNEAGASHVFRAALAIERERSPGSDLCGALMKRVSML
jgi:hypothetical protein